MLKHGEEVMCRLLLLLLVLLDHFHCVVVLQQEGDGFVRAKGGWLDGFVGGRWLLMAWRTLLHEGLLMTWDWLLRVVQERQKLADIGLGQQGMLKPFKVEWRACGTTAQCLLTFRPLYLFIRISSLHLLINMVKHRGLFRL